MKFKTSLQKFNSNLWGYHIAVPMSAVKKFSFGNQRRVICTLNKKITFQCGIMPNKNGYYFININKKIRDALKLKIGIEVDVILQKDDSEYGLQMPEELRELLKQDSAGNKLFQKLTPGRQRTLIYIAGNVKSTDKRINRAIAIVNHLKYTKGIIDYKLLQQDLKK